jgi:hypothetical protein
MFPHLSSLLISWNTHDHMQLKQNSEVKYVLNVIIIQKAITESSVGQHGPPTNAKVGSGAYEE